MKATITYRLLAIATAVMMLLFLGNRWFPSGKALQTEETIPTTVSTEPIPETIPLTQPTEPPPDPAEEACRAAVKKIKAGHIFVYDTADRKMVFSTSPSTEALYPASITKLFTAWVALQILEPDTVITAGKELGLLQPGSSTAFIAYGSRLTVKMLVEAMLLPSGNDAAYILSAAAGRELANDPELSAKKAVAVFLDEMNRQAAEVGLANSFFATPDGYHQESHHSCAGDLATIGELALRNEIIAKYMALQQDNVTFSSGETVTWYNTNRLLNPESAWYSEAAVGMKTGYTQEAGYCLLAAFQTENGHILVGIFDAENKLSRYTDAVVLFEAALTK